MKFKQMSLLDAKDAK